MKKLFFLPILLTLLLFSGCAFYPPIEPTTDLPTLKQNEASVTFIRNSVLNNKILTDIYDISPNGTVYNIGTSIYNTKLRYVTNAGHHVFAVRGEVFDFITADLEAGKHYYVTVSPTMGLVSARFKLTPVSAEKLANKATQNQISKLRTMESDLNMILPFYPKWQGLDDSKKVKLTSDSASNELY